MGRKAHVLGNIGEPFSQRVLDIKKEDFVSLEVSSFQLETITHFHPKIAVILNLTPDHLDRYQSVLDYYEAKKRIFENQDSGDWLVLNYCDERLRSFASKARSKVAFFNKSEPEACLNQNQLAVLAVGRILGIPEHLCIDIFKNFKGVEHRLEVVRDLRGVEFINDSKATNIESTVWALQNIHKPIILIAGGRDKGSNFHSLSSLVKEKTRFAVLLGEASDRIAQAWHKDLALAQVKTFKEAVALAFEKAQAGDCVLLSPMCKSFDMFEDYEHRGRVFKELVHKLV